MRTIVARRSWVLVLVAVFLFAAHVAMAQEDDAKAVEATLLKSVQAWNQGDFEAALSCVMLGSSGFNPEGGLLIEIPSGMTFKCRYILLREMSGGMPKRSAGMSFRNMPALRLGMPPAVTQADGETQDFMNRVSTVWVKEGEEWRIVHWHISHLRPPTAEGHD